MKILVTIPSYGDKNIHFLKRVINEFKSMPHEITIIVMSESHKEIDADVKVVVGLPDKNPKSLPFGHKRIFSDYADQYDFFIYTEDDTLITQKNIESYLEVHKFLPENELLGFLRFEESITGKKYYTTIHSQYRWLSNSVKTVNKYTFASFTNLHSACYILSNQQLKIALSSGSFFAPPREENYGMLETAATDIYTQCGFKKVICISHIEQFEVHHMPNIYYKKFGISSPDLHRMVDSLMKVKTDVRQDDSFFNSPYAPVSFHLAKDFYEPCRSDIISTLKLYDIKSVLSIGCGSCETEKKLLDNGIAVFAIPFDPVFGALAKSRGVEVLSSNINDAFDSIRNRNFDCILFMDVLQHMHCPEGIIAKFQELLSKNGIMISSAPNIKGIFFLYGIIRKASNVKKVLRYYDKEYFGIKIKNEKSVRKWFTGNRQKIERIEYHLRKGQKSILEKFPNAIKKIFCIRFILVTKTIN